MDRRGSFSWRSTRSSMAPLRRMQPLPRWTLGATHPAPAPSRPRRPWVSRLCKHRAPQATARDSATEIGLGLALLLMPARCGRRGRRRWSPRPRRRPPRLLPRWRARASPPTSSRRSRCPARLPTLGRATSARWRTCDGGALPPHPPIPYPPILPAASCSLPVAIHPQPPPTSHTALLWPSRQSRRGVGGGRQRGAALARVRLRHPARALPRRVRLGAQGGGGHVRGGAALARGARDGRGAVRVS